MADTKNTTKRRKTPTKKKLEETTRIRIDKDRIEDFDSLDTSFLEGRVKEKAKRDKKYKKNLLREKNSKSFDFSIITNILSILILLAVIIALIFVLLNNTKTTTNKIKKENSSVKENIIVDDNYLFIGDFNTEKLNFDELDYHYNKIFDANYTSSELLNNIDSIYRYNPSIVFIEIGINDLNNGINEAEITTNLSEIIDGIKKHRKYTKIYIESIYPINNNLESYDDSIINREVTNEKIISLNKMIEELTKDKKVEFINIYDRLLDKDNLDEKYTDNGIYLNEEGYGKVLSILQREIDNEHVKDD